MRAHAKLPLRQLGRLPERRQPLTQHTTKPHNTLRLTSHNRLHSPTSSVV